MKTELTYFKYHFYDIEAMKKTRIHQRSSIIMLDAVGSEMIVFFSLIRYNILSTLPSIAE